MSMLAAALLVFAATLFGGMIFFPSVVAPLVFKVLDAEVAGRFLRALFPRYYAFMIVTAGLAGLLALPLQRWLQAAVLLTVAASTLAIRQLLVPRINAWRDASLAGDEAATVRFERGHKFTVQVNVVQMVGVLWVLLSH